MSTVTPITVNVKPELRRGRALVLVGPQGCGKSRLARSIAQRYGTFVETTTSALANEFEFGYVLADEPSTVIVEGLPATESEMHRVKSLITNSQVQIHRKHMNPRTVRTPHLIFCSGDVDAIPLELGDRRFLVVPVRGQ